MDLLDYKDIYKNGQPIIDDAICEQLMQLSEIVLNKHYSFVSSYDRDDLKSEAVIKAIELIKEEKFDHNKSSLKNFLYTGMRNAMQNYLYHNKKEIPQEEFYVGVSDNVSVALGEVSYSVVYSVVSDYTRRNQISIRDICDYIISMGFRVVGIPSNLQSGNMLESLKEKLVCLILWKNQSEFCH